MTQKFRSSQVKVEKLPKDFFRVLIVDDEAVSRSLLRGILKTVGYTQIDEADSGKMAIASLSSIEYHLVLLDKNMPGADGLEVLRDGKAIQPDCEFIMITAYGSMESAIQAMDLGAYGYFTKPFSDLDLITRRVEAALDRVAMRRNIAQLSDRLQSMASELKKAEERIKELRDFHKSAPGTEQALVARVREAVHRLRTLAADIDRIRERSVGQPAAIIGKVEKEVSGIADILVGRA